MTEDNWIRQADEVEALSSIYGDDWCVEDSVERRYSIKISDGNDPPLFSLQLEVTFSDEYPSSAPPSYQLNATWLRREDRRQLDVRLLDTYTENQGESIVFKWIDTIREFLETKATLNDSSVHEAASPVQDDIERTPPQGNAAEHSDKEDDGSDVEDEFGFNPKLHVYHHPENSHLVNSPTDDVPLPEIHHGEKVTDRKSVFMGHLAAVTHKCQVKMVLDNLKENRKIAAATHNIYAFRIDGGNGIWMTGCEDDGEIHAGSRMLHLLDIMDARNVMVVVTRWYGGIHLGPDRFKHINNCTRDLLDQFGYTKDKSDKRGPKSTVAASQNRKKKR